MRISIAYLLLALVCATAGCSSPKRTQAIARPEFSADSAYQYIERQVNMGPRVPDTRAHTECLLYLMQQLERFGAVVECQHGTMPDYDGKDQHVINIIGHYGEPAQKGRILLAAHYDSRPWCDEEDDYDYRFMAVPGANDGASGVGVLLEIARQLGRSLEDSTAKVKPVDIVFFDCEDMGTPSFYTGQERQDTWCLGSQLWAGELLNAKDYQFGIVLDMVGAPDATFPKEYYSVQYAGNYVEKLWKNAARLGHGRYFVQKEAYPVTDDHFYVNQKAGIPTLDIIHYSSQGGTGFPLWWHTRKDDMRNINKPTLQAVGETVMSIL